MASWIPRRGLFTDDRPGATFEGAWRPIVRRRVLLVAACLGLWSVAIFGQLVKLQVFQHDEMLARAESQQLDTIKPPAARGDIVDRHGQILAYSVDSASIQADPKEVKHDAETARKLCAALGDCSAAELAEMTRGLGTDSRWLEIRKAREVTPDQLAAVTALDLPAVTFLPQTLRYYPKLDLAAHLLGYVGTENRGLGGLEARLDGEIRGRDGRVLVQRDAKAQRMFTRVEQAPTAGATVELTLDLTLQYIAERELRAGVAAARAAGGTAIIMDPHSGEILALANAPSFNPNAFAGYSDELRRNPAVQEIYEPGSTFKIVTAAAAIEEGVLSPTDPINCNPGSITFPGRKPITEAKGHNYGVLSFEDVIIKSSNIGAIRAGLKVGAEKMARFMRRFGFGQRLAPDFNGEATGIVHAPADLNDSDLASVSMGYNVSVTPMQMASAVSAIANGGLLYEPHVVRARIRDGIRTAIEPKVLRRAIAPATAATLVGIMEGVVERGTAKAAKLARYQVAGKTGTAAKIVNGAYSRSDYNSSFVGFVPSRRPVFTILVVIDTPRNGQYGGTVAAPVFRNIAEAALQQAGVPPSINPVPTVVVAADTDSSRPQPIRATSPPTITHAGGRPLMPDVRGLGAREALRVLGAVGLQVSVQGDGRVTAQRPEAGTPIEPGGWSTLQLQRAPPAQWPAGGGR